MATTHFIFSPSAGGSLRQVLKESNRDEAVHAFYDDLSFGPIAPPAAEPRCAWVEKNLHLGDWDEVTHLSEQFWTALSTAKGKRVIWLSRRSSNEYAGFLACLDHIGPGECDIIDMTDIRIAWIDRTGVERDDRLVSGTGMLSPEEILRNRLIDRHVPLSSEMHQFYLESWQKLQAENAPLRIIGNKELESASIIYFDDMLLSYASKDWQKMALIVGNGLAHWFDDDVRQVGDFLLAARIWTLIDEGRLEARGGLTSMRDTEIRLPS